VLAPGAPPPNPAALPNPPSNVPDPRSLFLSYAYTLAPLPAQPMKARRADQRVGYFTESYIDFADDSGGDRRSHLIRRWRLEKKDPEAAVSEPKEAIRVVMDRNIPEKWRAAVKSGILEWNKAFERAGWRNTIAVEQQPEGADWSALEGTRILAVRWFAIDGPGATAVAPARPTRAPARSCAAPPSFRRTGRASSARASATSSRRCPARPRPAPRNPAATPRTRWTTRASAMSCWRCAARSTPRARRPSASSRRP